MKKSELITSLTSLVQGNREDLAHEAFNQVELFLSLPNTEESKSAEEILGKLNYIVKGNGEKYIQTTPKKVSQAMEEYASLRVEQEVKKRSVEFATWYSGMTSDKVTNAFNRYQKEVNKTTI